MSCRIPQAAAAPRGVPGRRRSSGIRAASTDHIPNALAFSVESSVFFPTGRMPRIEHGACLMDHEWNHRTGTLAAESVEHTEATQG